MKKFLLDKKKNLSVLSHLCFPFVIGVREGLDGATIRKGRWLTPEQQRAWEEGMEIGLKMRAVYGDDD